MNRDRAQKNKLAALQAAITRGIESGAAGELDIEYIKKQARQLAGLASR